MTVRVVSLEEESALSEAASVVTQGGLIAFPTDTVYGLGASPYDPRAVEALYAAKGRMTSKAIPILIGSAADVSTVAATIPARFQRLAEAFWPGPLTIILTRHMHLPRDLSDLATVGVRVPDHDAARRLLQLTGPLAVTSANCSGDPEPRNAEDVIRALGEEIDLLLDGGETPGGRPSTVVALEGGVLTVLREGPIGLAHLEEVMADGEH